jgi:predicted metal-dependent phosphoesterase TrpH
MEVSCVSGRRDVHVLAYGFDPDSPAIAAFIQDQREHRVQRVIEMGERLAALGVPVDVAPWSRWRARRPGPASAGRNWPLP